MTRGDKIATFILVGYLLMIGVTHGYISSIQPDCWKSINVEYCNYRNEPVQLFGAALWPLWWASHATQELLK